MCSLAELIFIEGVSGVGKSTMVQKLAEALKTCGCRVKAYVEGDAENPIDFYRTAYLSAGQFKELCEKYPADAAALQTQAVSVGDVRLVRYCSGEVPLFKEPLLWELSQNEFCYHAGERVPLKEYTAVYKEIWRRYGAACRSDWDFILFDGSLLHHPINDMMRNYHVTGAQAADHVAALLQALGSTRYKVFYLAADGVEDRYVKARAARGQSAPTEAQIRFQVERYRNDLVVLERIGAHCRICEITGENWDAVKEQILLEILKKGNPR